MQLTRKIFERLNSIERPISKYAFVSGLLVVLVVLGAFAVSALDVPRTVENDFHMRGDQQTVNDFSSYILGDTQSSQPQSFSTQQDEGGFGTITTSYWGIRVFSKEPNSTAQEITGGSPVAVVSRESPSGPGYQSAQWTPPETGFTPEESLIVRVYQSIGQGNWQQASAFTTDQLKASRLNNEPWTVNYYTELENAGSGGFFGSTITQPTFYWGDSTQDSGINGINYSLARVESQQTRPDTELDTWPGQTFEQEVQVTCRASTCQDVSITPQACSGAICSNYRDAGSFEGLSWNTTEYTVPEMNRMEAVTKTFTVTADSEETYRLRASINSSNVATGDTSSTKVNVEVADVDLEQLEHENLFEHGVNQYETGDTIDFFNTSLLSYDEYSYWLVGTSNPTTVKIDQSSQNLDSEPEAPINNIVSGDSTEEAYYLGGGNGELTKWNGTFSQISSFPSSDTITAISTAENKMFLGTGSPRGYLYNFETGNFQDLGSTGATPRSATQTYDQGLNGNYFLVGTSNPSVLRITSSSITDVTPAFIQDTVHANARNSTHIFLGDASGNSGLYDGQDFTQLSGLGLDGSYSIRSAEWGAFQDGEVTRFWLIGAGSGQIRKLYPNGTVEDLTGDLPGSWTVETIEYSPERDEFLIGGTSGNLYSYDSSGFTDITPSSISNGGGTVNAIAYSKASGGKAFDLQVDPSFTAPDGTSPLWGPTSTESCENISRGGSCEKQFNTFEIPETAQPGDYNFSVSYDWENFGPGLNESLSFELIDIRETINSSIDDRPLFTSSSTLYDVSIRNKWNGQIENLDISVNCPSELSCSEEDAELTTLNSGQETNASYNITAPSDIPTGFYTVNATVSYDNPDESKQYSEIEPITFKVADGSLLLTTIESQVPEKIVRGESLVFNGSLLNNGDPASGVSLNYTLPSAWSTSDPDKFFGTVSSDQKVWHNITANVGLPADKGPNTVYLNSTADAEPREDFDREIIDVYSGTSVSLSLDTEETVQGNDVGATATLEEDSGALLSGQRILFYDNLSGDRLGSSFTGSQGKASITFTVPNDWEVDNHSIVAEYESNETIYAGPSKGSDEIVIHDRPNISTFSADPEETGLGKSVTINSSVFDGDRIKTVEALIRYPSGDEKTISLTNSSENPNAYTGDFTSGWENGFYDFKIIAEDEDERISETGFKEFYLHSNATLNVVTDKDVYGPYSYVSLSRSRDVSDTNSEEFATLTEELFIEDSYASEFSLASGSVTDVENTRELDGMDFEMTQTGGGFGVDYTFEGTYSYEVQVDDLTQIDFSSYGSVTGSSWNIEVRNYGSQSWEQIATVSSTTDSWTNNTGICSSACSNYISNNNIQIRVTSTTSWTDQAYSYNVDFQKLRVTGNDGTITETEQPSDPVSIGVDGQNKNRYSTRFEMPELPYNGSAQVQSAVLWVNVSGGAGTGEIYTVQNFQEITGANSIHSGNSPPSATQTNPIETFSTTQGLKQIPVTQAVQNSFEAGKKNFSFQVREQAEDQTFTVERPLNLTVNYTAESEIYNTGSTGLSGNLELLVQKRQSGSWTDVESVLPFRRINISSGTDYNLSQVWNSEGGFSTSIRSAGDYRVLARLFGTQTLSSENGGQILDTYNFSIGASEPRLTSIEHDNFYQGGPSVNEFGTGDLIDFVNVSVSNSEFEAAQASVLLDINRDGRNVSWGPNSRKSFGDIPAGDTAERRWDNSSNGYEVPLEAASGTFSFNWDTVIDAANANRTVNRTLTFEVHNVPNNFSSEIVDSDNRIYRNNSVIYNFSIDNPWSQNISQVNVTVNCKESEIGCEEEGGTSSTVNLGDISAGGTGEASFNITTNYSETEIGLKGNYDINATVEYINPGGEQKTWPEYKNKILKVREPGSFLNITDAPSRVIRTGDGYDIDAYANNTYDETLDNHIGTWEIPEEWTNTTGNLTVTNDTHQPGELIWHNFTASVSADAELGEKRINLSTDNDQGRVDLNFRYIDVYSPTELDIQLNRTDPAKGEEIEIKTNLSYLNGTPIQGEEIIFTNEKKGETIGTAFTNSTGYAVINYRAERPYTDQRINASYSGSETLYTLGSNSSQNVTVRDRPNITDLNLSDDSLGFGYNNTVNVSVTDRDGIQQVNLTVFYPNLTEKTFQMTDQGGGLWSYEFGDTWQYGDYDIAVEAIDNFQKSTVERDSFQVKINQISSIRALNNSYSPGEDVSLTDYASSWFDRDWDYRRKIEVQQTTGTDLTRYPVRVQISNLGSNTYSCDDLRVVENTELKDYYLESCNPAGETVLYTTANISASATEADLYVYYGNSEAQEFNNETFAYRINDSGNYAPGNTDIDRTFTYNNGDAVFRRVALDFFGDYDSVTVSGYNTFTDSSTTLYSGAGASFTDTFYQNPRFTEIRVQMQGTGGFFDTPPSFDYNYTTPLQTSTSTVDTQDLLPSIIENTGTNPFKGRVLLQVERNESGTWQEVSTRYNDSSPSDIQSGETVNVGTLWNDNPWNTGKNPAGTYRAAFKLLGPSGNLLSDSQGSIIRTDQFQVEEPASDVNINSINVYNVTGRNQQSSTGDLEASGRNTTLTVFGGDTYRIDVFVDNSESAESNWDIDSNASVQHQGLNSSWSVSDIFYNISGTQYTGGSFSGGTVEWSTGSGQLAPGENASFSYVIDLPNNGTVRDINFEVNDTSFTETDNSVLEVEKRESVPPTALLFELNTTSIIRGEDIKAYANWSETISSSKAEYNITSSLLVNNTVQPDNTWTNYSLSTTSDWKRGNHSFRFYADDSTGNTGSTSMKFFEVFGLASVSDTKLNETRVLKGDTTRFSCRVTSDAGEPVQDYEVTFVRERDDTVLETKGTNSTGWASTDYSSSQLGYENLSCGITRNESRFFETGTRFDMRQIRIVEEQPPEFNSSRNSINATRIFRNIRNDTVRVTSYWTDNQELNYSSVVLGDTSAPNLTVPEPRLETQQLMGQQSWANFTLRVSNTTERRDSNLTVYTNDTSSNVNSTVVSNDFQIWSWASIGTTGFRDSAVETDVETTLDCAVGLGNNTGINGYDVNFYDNATAEDWRYLGTNQTRTISGASGIASWTKSYSTSGEYEWKCNISASQQKNIQPLPSAKNATARLTVGQGDVKAPVITGGYGINKTDLYRGNSLKTFAKWNETIDYSYAEYDKNESYITDKVSEPYTNNWTNYTLRTDENWTVGNHQIKLYANDTSGNLNDTLSYQDFDVYGKAEVNWISPTGTVEKGLNKLKCSVNSVYGSRPIENYQVAFSAGSTTDFNSTNSEGVATYEYNSSDDSTGTKQWSCSIGDEPGLYYNASENNTDTEQIELVEELASTVSGNLTRPVDGTTLAQNKTFTSNVTIKCQDGDCGEVNASLRYNSSSLEPDTVVPEASGEPFYTVGSNTKSCNLNQGENCTLSFEVNATGEQNQEFNLDAQIQSPNAETNDTEDKEVTIDLVLITDFEYSEVAFPDAAPNETVSAPGNSGGSYSFMLTENSNDAAGAWIKMTNLTSSTSDYELRPQNTVWTLRGSSCGSADGGNSMTHSYSPLLESLEAGTTVTQCYWQHIPFGKREGTYQGTISIKVNATE